MSLWNDFADRALAGELLSNDEARAVLAAPDDALLDQLAAAYRAPAQSFLVFTAPSGQAVLSDPIGLGVNSQFSQRATTAYQDVQTQATLAVDAYEQLARGASRRLFLVASRVLRDPDEAEDAVQRTLVAMWQDLPRLRDPDRFEAWTYRMVIHQCRNAGRKERREREGR